MSKTLLGGYGWRRLTVKPCLPLAPITQWLERPTRSVLEGHV